MSRTGTGSAVNSDISVGLKPMQVSTVANVGLVLGQKYTVLYHWD